MAPLNPNNTARLKVFYQNSQAEHSLIIRLITLGDAPEAEVKLQAILALLGVSFSASTITAVQIADEGSDIFLDYGATTLIGDNWGSDAATEESNATAMTFVGRSTVGRRAKFAIFGYKNALSEFRITGAEVPAVASAVTELNTTVGEFIAIDGTHAQWKNYVNIKAYDHWVDVARNG